MNPLRRAIDHAASRLGLFARRERAMRGTLTILMYHRVLPPALWPKAPLPNLAMPEPAFREQMELIASRFTPVRLDEGLRALRDGRASARAMVAVTFDDGYLDNHAFAHPILKKYSIPATFFVVAGYLGTDAELWFDRAARIVESVPRERILNAVRAAGHETPTAMSRAEFLGVLKSLAPPERDALLDAIPVDLPPRGEFDRLMSFAQARELAEGGHDIGSHTITHPILTTLATEDLRREVAESRLMLERELGRPVRGFCAPNGSFNDEVLDAVRGAGYEYAPTTRPGRLERVSSPLTLPRIDMNPHHATNRGEPDRALALAEITLFHHDLRNTLRR